MQPIATSPSDSLSLVATSASGCIVLRPAGQALPASVSAWLERRAWNAIEFDDPLAAMATLCLLDKAQLHREAWGLQRVEPTGLMIVEPLQWPSLPDLLAALKLHLPDAGIWIAQHEQITTAHQPRLAPLEIVVLPRERPQPRAESTRPALRLATADEEPARDPEPPAVIQKLVPPPAAPLRLEPPDSIDEGFDQEPQPPDPSVSRDELNMLLAEDPA